MLPDLPENRDYLGEFISDEDLNELSFEEICYLLDDLYGLVFNDYKNQSHWKPYGYKMLNILKNRLDNL